MPVVTFDDVFGPAKPAPGAVSFDDVFGPPAREEPGLLDSFLSGARGALEGPRMVASTIASGVGALRKPIDEAATYYSRLATGANPLGGETESAGQIAADALVPPTPEEAGSDISPALSALPGGIGAAVAALERARQARIPGAEHAAGVARSGVRLAGDLATDPTAVVLGELRAAGAGGAAAERAIAAAFAGEMGPAAVESAGHLKDEVVANGWSPRAAEMLTDLVGQAGLTAAAVHSVAAPEPAAALRPREGAIPLAKPGDERFVERQRTDQVLEAVEAPGTVLTFDEVFREPDLASEQRGVDTVPVREVPPPAAGDVFQGDTRAAAAAAGAPLPPSADEYLVRPLARALEEALDRPADARPRLTGQPAPAEPEVFLSPDAQAVAEGRPLPKRPAPAAPPAPPAPSNPLTGLDRAETPAAPTHSVRYHDNPTVDAEVRASLPVIAEALDRGRGTPGGLIPTGTGPGDFKRYGPVDTGVKAAFGLDGMPEDRHAIAAAIRRDKGNPLEMEVASRVGARVEEQLDAGTPSNMIDGTALKITREPSDAVDTAPPGADATFDPQQLEGAGRPARYEETAQGLQGRLAGTTQPQSAPTIRTEGREAAGPLFTQAGDAAARAEARAQTSMFDGDAALSRLNKGSGATAHDLGSAIAEGGRVLKDIATYGASLIERGIRSFPEWSRAMHEALGGAFRDLGQHLRRLYGEARRAYLAEREAAFRAERAPAGSDEWMRHPERGAVKVGGGKGTPTPDLTRSEPLDLAAAPTKPAAASAPAAKGEAAAEKLVSLVKEAKPVLRETQRLRHSERIKRAEEVARIASAVKGEGGLAEAKGALRGELPRADFQPVRPKMTQTEVDHLFNTVWKHPELRPYERVRAADALYNLLDQGGGRLPQRNELLLLEKVFGPKLTEAILSKRGNWERAKDFIADAVNLPRAVMSSFDMSAPLRQGLVLTVGRPRLAGPAFTGMVRAFFGEKAYKAIDADLNVRPNANLYDATGLYLAGRQRALDLTQREERFMSNLAEKVPGMGWVVRASERAYISYLNKLRADTFDALTTEYKKGGVTPEKSPEVYNALASYINMATGRGSLGAFERAAPLLNGAFFSPRFMAARLKALNPATYARMPKQVRVEAMKDALSTVGAGLAVVSLAKLQGASVETDPRSSDFGKIKMGETRIDVWGGFQQYVRFLAQITSGQRKTLSGEMVDLTGKTRETRGDAAVRFARTKLAPGPGVLTDLMFGAKDVTGRPVDAKRLAETVIPMYVQDALAAMREHGPAKGFLISSPAFFGVGVSTYERQERGARP